VHVNIVSLLTYLLTCNDGSDLPIRMVPQCHGNSYGQMPESTMCQLSPAN